MKRLATLICLSFCCLGFALGMTHVVLGQNTADETAQVADGEPKSKSDVTLSVVPGGMKRSVPGRWATMAVNGVNRSDQDVQQTVIVQFGENTDTQFARRIWIPAKSRRQAWLPVLMPNVDTAENPQLKMKSIQLKGADATEQFQSNAVGSPISERALMLSRETSRSAIALDANHSKGMRYFNELLDSVYICRDSSVSDAQDLGMVNYSAQFLPPGPKTLDAIDQFIVANEEILTDTAMAARLRQWVQDGGRLWVLVDQLSTSATKELLGELTCFSEVDRVGLNEFQLEHFESLGDKPSSSSSQSTEEPFEMVRVFTDDVSVSCKIDGWPAAFWQPVGQGQILYTTIDVRGLVYEGKPLKSFGQVVGEFFGPREKSNRYSALMARMTDREIGYQVPSRKLIAWVLGIQVVLMLLVGVHLARQKRLHLLAALVPLTALTAAGILLWLGKQNSTSVKPTIALGQFARVLDGGSEIQLDSTTAIYSPDARELDLHAASGSAMTFADGEAEQERKRLLWTDSGESQWMNMRQPPGVVRHVNSQSTIRLEEQWSAVGNFSPEGFKLQLNGVDPSQCEDLVVASESTPTLSIKQIDDGLVGSAEDILGENQFVDGSLVSDRQRQRQDVLRQLIAPRNGKFGRDPTVLLWTKPFGSGLKMPDSFDQKGDALLSVPITYQRQAPNSQFTVPSNFVRLELNLGQRGFSPLFNPRTGEWLEDVTKPQTVELDCFIPPSLLPCKLDSATIKIKLNAPSRTLQLKGVDKGQYIVLHEQENPSGLITVNVDRADCLHVDDSGAMRLVVSILKTEQEIQDEQKLPGETSGRQRLGRNEDRRNGDRRNEDRRNEDRRNGDRNADRVTAPSTAQATQQRTWQIDFLRVSVTGKTL